MNNVEIGNRIKQRRKELGLTQLQIYEKTGISSGNLSGIENGKSLPSSAALINLSTLLQCSIDYLLKGDSLNSENILTSEIRDTLSLSPTEEMFIHCFRQLEPTDQDEVLHIINHKLRQLKRNGKSTNSNQEDCSASA